MNSNVKCRLKKNLPTAIKTVDEDSTNWAKCDEMKNCTNTNVYMWKKQTISAKHSRNVNQTDNIYSMTLNCISHNTNGACLHIFSIFMDPTGLNR